MLTRWLIPIVLFAAAEQPSFGPIRFEDATGKAGIAFTHSFGAEKLGSLLESTGAGAVWFDYNNDGLSGPVRDQRQAARRPACTPTRCASRRKLLPHNHLYRNDTATAASPTSRTSAGRARRPLQHGRHRRRLR